MRIDLQKDEINYTNNFQNFSMQGKRKEKTQVLRKQNQGLHNDNVQSTRRKKQAQVFKNFQYFAKPNSQT